MILNRCIISINGKHPSQTKIENLSQKTKNRIQKRMEDIDKFTYQEMSLTCPECGIEFLAPFDIQDFFLNELNSSFETFFREVHYLAYYYPLFQPYLQEYL